MADERLNRIKRLMAAKRERQAQAASEAAAASATRQYAAANAAGAWSGTQSMMQKVLDDINLELDEDDPKLVLEFVLPQSDNRLGEGSVGLRRIDGLTDLSFTAWSSDGTISIRLPDDRRSREHKLPLLELDKDQWRELLYEYMEARLRI